VQFVLWLVCNVEAPDLHIAAAAAAAAAAAITILSSSSMFGLGLICFDVVPGHPYHHAFCTPKLRHAMRLGYSSVATLCLHHSVVLPHSTLCFFAIFKRVLPARK
jgi:hypothetical protein